MANGDQNNGFNSLFPAGLPETPTGGYRPLFERSEQKAASVAAASEEKQQTLVDKLGLDVDSTPGMLTNLAASFASGATRTAGYLATAPIDYISNLASASVPDLQVDAYSRMKRGEALPGDELLLNEQAPSEDGVPQTYLQRLESVDGLRQISKNIAEAADISSIVDQDERGNLRRALKDSTIDGQMDLLHAGGAWESGDYLEAAMLGAKGVARITGNALAEGVTQPTAVAEYTVENVPQILASLLNPVAGAAVNAGYGLNEYRDGITDYQAENQGALPSAEERLEMGLWATAAAAVEQVADVGLVKGIRAGAKGGVTATAGAVAGAGVREGVTEGFQTYAEARAHLKEATLDEIIEGATIGALVGANFRGASALGGGEVAPAQQAEQSAAVEQAFTSAVETGDVSALADRNAATYDPVRAIQALNQASKTASPEAVQANLTQADNIQKDLTTQVSTLQARLDRTSPESIEQTRELVKTMEAAGASQAEIGQVNQILEALESYTPEQRKADESALARLDGQLTAVQQENERLRIDTTPEQAEIDTLVQNAEAGDQSAINSVLTLTMTNPDAVDTQVIAALAQSGNLSAEQRTALARFSDAQVAANALKGRAGVRSDIATGGDGFKGINQYRDALRMALATGNTEVARSQVDGIASFAASRQSKLEAITTAYEQVKGTNNSINIVRDADNNWGPTNMTGKALKKAGGLVIDARSFKLRDDVSFEADALAKTAAAFEALVQAAPAPVAAPVVQPEVAEQGEVAETPAEPAVADATAEAEQVAPVNAEPEVEASLEEAVAPEEDGTLSVIQARTGVDVTADNYTSVNLVSELFTQTPGNPDTGSVRPLVSVRNFMSKVRAGEVSMVEFLNQEGPVSMPQQAALNSFTSFAQWSEQAIRDVFKVTDTRAQRPDFFYRDMAQFLQNQDGEIDENLATAVSLAMYSWVNENATQLRNSDEAINAILLRDSDEEISPIEYRELSKLGVRESVVASQLGGRVIQALGLSISQQGTVAEMAKLESTVGARVLAAMANLGLVTRQQYSDAKLQALMKTGEKGNPNMPHTFIAIPSQEVDGRLVASPRVRRIREANTGSQSVLSKVFSVEAAGVEPSYTPVKFDMEFVKRSNVAEVPAGLADTLNKEGARAHNLRQNMWHVWGKLSLDTLATIGGAIDTTTAPTHVENAPGVIAKSDGIRQQVENFDSFIKAMFADETTEGLEQDLFFGRSVWTPQRVGLTANVINPQTSKIHRHMLAMKGWGATVDMNDQASVNNFNLRILEAFGVKTEANNTAKVLAGYDAKVNTPAIQAGVDALVDILRDSDVPVNESAILAAVAAAGENFHSFDALVALAEQKIALANGATSFDTSMMGEVDGVTNGPMLSIVMLGAKGWETLTQGGFFPLGSPYTQFNDYKADGGLDLYESNIAAAVARLQGAQAQYLAALQVITGKLTTDDGKVSKKGRNAIKQPLTALMFGSNPKSAVDGMADGFIDSIYKRMEEAAGNRDQADMTAIVAAVNQLIPNKRLHLNPTLGIDEALNTSLTSDQKATLKGTFYELLGKPTEEALGDTYATFIARRNVINQTAQTAFQVYNAVREGVTAYVLENSGAVPRNNAGEAIRTLTKAQEKQIAEILGDMAPILQTAMSQAADQRQAGMFMAKSEKRMDSSKPFESEAAFGEKAQTIGLDGMMKGIGSSRVSASVRGDVDPGVMPFITSIHSTDSFIASSVYRVIEALNVHDALGVDLNNVSKVGQELNKATYQAMLNYSAPTAMATMLEEVLAGAARVMNDAALAEKIQPLLQAVAQERAGRKLGTFEDQVVAIRATATQSDTDKLNMLAEMQAVGQYATDMGSYMVTDADRTAAAKKLAEVGTNFNPATQSIAQELDSVAGHDVQVFAQGQSLLSAESFRTLAPATSLNSLDAVLRRSEGQLAEDVAAVMDTMVSSNATLDAALQTLPEVRAADVTAAVQAETGPLFSVWGQIGEPVVKSDANLVELLEGTELNAQQLAETLSAYVTDPFQRTVLLMARKAIPSSVKVQYVTPETPVDGAFGEGVDKSRGWYAQRPGSEVIFVKSPAFVESGLTAEMLTHELVHAALANIVDANQGKQTAVGRVVGNLDVLRLKAANLIASNSALAAKYRNATSNVHELLAWGLTNQDFQKEVLTVVEMPTTNNTILDGLKSFIRNITAMLFGGSVKETSGMAMLVANSAGLFREATRIREARETRTLKYEDAMDHVNAMTSEQVFDALGNLPGVQVDGQHADYLRQLLDVAVTPLYGPYGAFKEQAKADMAVTPLDVFLKAVDTGNMPFSSLASQQAFILSKQEAFVLESVEAVVQEAIANPNTLFVRTGLENLFKQARETLKPYNFHPGDWNTASAQEKKIAEEKYSFVFRPVQNAGAKHSYLARFAALGLVSNEVRNVLQFSTANAQVPLKSLPWASRLTELFRRLMTKLANLHTKVIPGMAGNQALRTLVGQLVDIEAKHRRPVAEKKIIGLDEIETYLGGVAGSVREKLDAMGQSDFMRKSKIPGFKFAGVALSTIAGDRLDAILDHITHVRDVNQKTAHGLMMGMLTEWRGVYDSRRLAAELFKGAKAIEQERKATIENTVSAVNSAFENQGQNLTQEQRDALTKVFLRTNASAISAAHGFDRLKELMEDPAKMAAYRADLEAQVKAATRHSMYMISQTKDLAHHRVVGGATSANLMQSPRNIAKLYGTGRVSPVDAEVNAVVPLLEQLQAVYALEYTGDLDMRQAQQVLRTEARRADGNGVDFILKLHAGLQTKSTEMLFQGTEALQMAGYTPEIHDNKIEVLLVAPKDVAAHIRAGYQVGTRLQQDPNFSTNEQRVLMTRRGAGQVGLLTGAMSFTGMSARGTSPVTEAKNMMGPQTTSAAARQQIARAKRQAINDLFNRGASYDPRKVEAGHMAPTLAPDGQIADYRHMMTEHNRDVLLDRDNSMDQVLGVLAGQIVDKVSSASQNADVVRSMYDQYRMDYNNRPSSYLMVGKDSTDPKLAELYRLLPESTKKEINKVWKSDNMYIPADQIDMIMGYRKFSLTNAFDALPTERNVFENTLVRVSGAIFGEKAGLRIGQAEDIIQTLVREAKDILVVKNIFTLTGNIMSNMTLLAWEGVPVKDMAASHAVAIKGALDFRKDSKRLMQLQQAIEIGYTEPTPDVEAEIVALRDRLARNPIKPLVDAGLMPTIVEDVEVSDDRYSYKSILGRKVERFTSKVPAWARTVGRQVYMTHDTATYKFLSQTTQLSDLVARYTLYKHATTRAKDPMSSADALRLAEDSFVNYDLPSHRTLQYLNDMGVVMFTKYYLRIQKVIMRLVRERPARGLMLAALNHYWAGLQSVMDSSWINKIGNNPLEWGPLGYLGALGELPAIKLMD